MPTIADIYDELSNGRVFERPVFELHPKRRIIRGYCARNGTITVNHIPDTLDTLVHELLHRRFPQWTERTVRRETSKLVDRMTPREQRRLYTRYCRIKKASERALSVP